MAEQFHGKVEFLDSNGNVIFTFDPDSTFVQFVHNTSGGFQAAQLTNTGSFSLAGAVDKHGALLDGSIGSLVLGGSGRVGRILLLDDNNNEIMLLNATTAEVFVGAAGNEGDIVVRDGVGRDVISLDGNNAALFAGASGNAGDILVRDGAGRNVFHLDGNNADLYVGAEGNEGDIGVRDRVGRGVFHFYGNSADLYVGASGNEGDIVVRDGAGRNVLSLDGNSATLFVGANGNEGDIIVRDGVGRDVFDFDGSFAVLRVGANGNEGDIIVRNDAGAEVIHLNGGTGDILLSNADAAENFDVAESAEATPGTLMVLNHEGKLEPSSVPYDKKVVGVVAGAGDYRSGIVLDHKDGATGRAPISVLGKVSCKVDAAYGPIEVGDLLTTSPTTGHAMKVSDPGRAFGSVIGKVLSPLREGAGLANVLVNLQ